MSTDTSVWAPPSTNPLFADREPEPGTILYYMPRRLSSQDIAHFERLLLRATVSCGWAFRWVENQEVRELFQFVNPGLTLPLRNTLSGRILRESTMEVHEKIELIAKDDKIGLTIAFDGWTNVVHQSILGAVLITSGGRSLVWGAEDMSGVRKTALMQSSRFRDGSQKAKKRN